jgi:hypothetical protein
MCSLIGGVVVLQDSAVAEGAEEAVAAELPARLRQHVRGLDHREHVVHAHEAVERLGLGFELGNTDERGLGHLPHTRGLGGGHLERPGHDGAGVVPLAPQVEEGGAGALRLRRPHRDSDHLGGRQGEYVLRRRPTTLGVFTIPGENLKVLVLSEIEPLDLILDPRREVAADAQRFVQLASVDCCFRPGDGDSAAHRPYPFPAWTDGSTAGGNTLSTVVPSASASLRARSRPGVGGLLDSRRRMYS